MGETPRQEEPETEINPLKSEHLAEGFKPITPVLATENQWMEKLASESELSPIRASGEKVSYYSTWDPADAKRLNFKNAGPKTYVISSINERSKFTEMVANCTSLIAVGRDKETGEEVSFLTHQHPREFHKNSKDPFEKDLRESLEELRKRCVDKSIDVVIAGGLYDPNDDPEFAYEKSLDILAAVVKETLGFSPAVVSGPKEGGADDVFFDTANRRLYVVRPSYDKLHNESFSAEDAGKMVKKWSEGQENRPKETRIDF